VTDDLRDYLSEEEAARLWQRAAQLQAEAARLAEASAANAAADDLDASADEESRTGYALTHVRAAALEAGISEEFVDAALSDLRAEQAAGAGTGGRLAKRILGNPDDAVVVRRVIQAPVQEVLRAMEEVMPGEPYGLSLRDRRGDPTAGGVIIFDIPGAGFSAAAHPGFVGSASHADFRQVFASVHAVGDGAAELTLRAPVAWARNLNAGIGLALSGLGAGLGMGVGSALAAGAAATLTGLGLAAAAPWAAGALVVTGLVGGGAGGHRILLKLYRYGLGKGESALQGLVGGIAMKAEGGWGFQPKELSPARDDGVSNP
jgi:hypothetical protein